MTTVLLVEDSLTESEILTRYLQQVGLNVVLARDGMEAQYHLNQQRPDLIVLDVILPGQSGFELCRELKASTETDGIPVIMCSTKDTDADKLWGNMLGADAYLPKPVNQQEFVNTVQQLIGR
ncbi:MULTISPECIES: response regulator [unclassified Leptolyngbya]|uniref:response regulator transcription factor n=1 Tax=unclassified Leptolyngbya TaxID=2650499 RepID=UPI0016868FE0|nr:MULTISPECIES: response regulator [unclassified Leptolyngbya]MBD1909423.1 response regulator [Leptolyngbya sp. FACHB-8]MBD2158587.1 response regulator [Leptolyngbya sp. FACHB-16]